MSIRADDGRGTLQAGGKDLEWAAFGDHGSGPAVVMLHEGLGSVTLWRDFPERLAEAAGLPVFAYSRAGHGQSEAVNLPRPLDYMTREAVDVLPDVIDAIGAPRVVLLGHSDGATIAAEYAGRMSDHRVRGLVLIAPHFFTEPTGLEAIAGIRGEFETGDLKERMAKHHRDPEATFRGWNDAWLDPGFADWNVGEVIDYLRVPSLVIQGLSDRYGTADQVTEVETRSHAPVETLLLEGCGHHPHLEAPGETLAAVTGFLARLIRIENEVVEVA